MNPLIKEIRHNPLLWLIVFVPVLFTAQKLKPEATERFMQHGLAEGKFTSLGAT